MAKKIEFSDKELQEMIERLNKGETKTSVAKHFGISPTTLTKKIDEFHNQQQKLEERKQAKKHSRLSQDEIDLIKDYYINENWSMNKIANFIQRSIGAVKRALENANIPIRKRSKKTTDLIPTNIGDTESPLNIGDKVFSFKYNTYATVKAFWGEDGDIFRIWVESDSSQFSAYQPRESLALLPT